MKKILYILILSLLLVPVSFVNATNVVTIPQDITIGLTSMDLTLRANSTFSSMEVNGDTLTFVISPSGHIVVFPLIDIL